MPLLRADAERLSNNQLVSGVIEEIIKRDAIYALLPFVGTNHKAYVYNREGTIPTVSFYDVNSAIGEGAPTNSQVTVTLKILAHNLSRLAAARKLSCVWCLFEPVFRSAV